MDNELNYLYKFKITGTVHGECDKMKHLKILNVVIM